MSSTPPKPLNFQALFLIPLLAPVTRVQLTLAVFSVGQPGLFLCCPIARYLHLRRNEVFDRDFCHVSALKGFLAELPPGTLHSSCYLFQRLLGNPCKSPIVVLGLWFLSFLKLQGRVFDLFTYVERSFSNPPFFTLVPKDRLTLLIRFSTRDIFSFSSIPLTFRGRAS